MRNLQQSLQLLQKNIVIPHMDVTPETLREAGNKVICCYPCCQFDGLSIKHKRLPPLIFGANVGSEKLQISIGSTLHIISKHKFKHGVSPLVIFDQPLYWKYYFDRFGRCNRDQRAEINNQRLTHIL